MRSSPSPPRSGGEGCGEAVPRAHGETFMRLHFSLIRSSGKRSVRLSEMNYVTLQPPLPLQLFFPLQPWSPVLQPPCPLQLFWPLQSCLFMLLESDADVPALEQPVIVRAVPATSPVMAAEMINVLAVRFIVLPSLLCACCLLGERNRHTTSALLCVSWVSHIPYTHFQKSPAFSTRGGGIQKIKFASMEHPAGKLPYLPKAGTH